VARWAGLGAPVRPRPPSSAESTGVTTSATANEAIAASRKVSSAGRTNAPAGSRRNSSGTSATSAATVA
jgi:hypothetical protein